MTIRLTNYLVVFGFGSHLTAADVDFIYFFTIRYQIVIHDYNKCAESQCH